jgi:hypothetical protein
MRSPFAGAAIACANVPLRSWSPPDQMVRATVPQLTPGQVVLKSTSSYAPAMCR